MNAIKRAMLWLGTATEHETDIAAYGFALGVVTAVVVIVLGAYVCYLVLP